MYYSELATIVETLPIVPNKFSITTTKDYFADMYFLVKKTTQLFDVSELTKNFVLFN